MRFENRTYDEERALYGVTGAQVVNCRFEGPADGESALKETRDIEVTGCYFNLRYPLWHVTGGVVRDIVMEEGCRASMWYDKDLTVEDSRLHGIKAFRECEDITLRRCDVNSKEFAWHCDGMELEDVTIESEYPFLGSRNIRARGLRLTGKYYFQYVEDSEFSDIIIDTKDAFWHAKNVTVRDSVIKTEYLAWYSENLRLINCRLIGTQPLCYCKGLVLENCTMEGADLAFERSEVRADVRGGIDSVKNPIAGRIEADGIGELIMDPAVVPEKGCEIVIRK